MDPAALDVSILHALQEGLGRVQVYPGVALAGLCSAQRQRILKHFFGIGVQLHAEGALFIALDYRCVVCMAVNFTFLIAQQCMLHGRAQLPAKAHVLLCTAG
jgi:hypothetical protein